MAATAVYCNITRIPEGDHRYENVAFSNIAATTAAFSLTGGKYAVDVIGSTFGTVTLERLGPDGTTMLTALAAFSATGTANADLPPGQYKLAIG